MSTDNPTETENLIAAAIDNAEEIQDQPVEAAQGQKPRLLIENCDPDRTVAALRNILSDAGGLYDRGVRPTRLRPNAGGGQSRR
jgi:hypothetical protein